VLEVVENRGFSALTSVSPVNQTIFRKKANFICTLEQSFKVFLNYDQNSSKIGCYAFLSNKEMAVNLYTFTLHEKKTL
jgi:hypothetical protein